MPKPTKDDLMKDFEAEDDGDEEPKYGGVHFLGTGTYTAENQAAADQLYKDLQKATKGN